MNLFFECLPQDNSPITKPVPKNTSTKLPRRKTRRGKKKKTPQALKWEADKAAALKLYKQQKRERAQQFSDFQRAIGSD